MYKSKRARYTHKKYKIEKRQKQRNKTRRFYKGRNAQKRITNDAGTKTKCNKTKDVGQNAIRSAATLHAVCIATAISLPSVSQFFLGVGAIRISLGITYNRKRIALFGCSLLIYVATWHQARDHPLSSLLLTI